MESLAIQTFVQTTNKIIVILGCMTQKQPGIVIRQGRFSLHLSIVPGLSVDLFGAANVDPFCTRPSNGLAVIVKAIFSRLGSRSDHYVELFQSVGNTLELVNKFICLVFVIRQ
jgi:hypothetical protein